MTDYFPALPAPAWYLVGLISLAVMIDKSKLLKQSFKERIAELIILPSHTTLHTSLLAPTTYYNIISYIYRMKSPISFFARSSIVSITFLTIIIATQHTLNPEAFNKITKPYLLSLSTLTFSAVLILLSVCVVDFISSYFTIMYLRIARNCNNVAELLFIALSDLVMSMVIFILIFPIFLVTITLTKPVPRSEVQFTLSSNPVKGEINSFSFIGSLLAFHPTAHLKSEDGSDDFYLDVMRYNVGATRRPSPTDMTLEEAIDRMDMGSSIIIQERGFLDNKELYRVITGLLARTGSLENVTLMDVHDGIFSNYALLKATPTYEPSLSHILDDYWGTVRQVAFFNRNLFSVITLGSHHVTTSDIYETDSQEQIQHSVFSGTKIGTVYCDGKYTAVSIETMDNSDPASLYIDMKKYSHCAKVASLVNAMASSLTSLYVMQRAFDLPVPISVFAMSSLATTILVYYLLILRVLSPAVVYYMSLLTSDGPSIVSRYAITIMVTISIIAFAPLYFLIYYFII